MENSDNYSEEYEIYSTEDIIEIAGKVVEDILCLDVSIYNDVLVRHPEAATWWNKGPLSWFVHFSKGHNPRGHVAIDIEELTMRQRGIVSDLVGKAILNKGSKCKDPFFERDMFKFSSCSLPSKGAKDGPSFSPSEWREMKQQAMVDSIIRAIDSK